MKMDLSTGPNRQRTAALAVVLLSAVISLEAMFRVGRHNTSVVLVLLFTVWVASPFAGLLWMWRRAMPRQEAQQTTCRFISLISGSSVAVYAAVAYLVHLKKPAGPFLAVPAASWLLIAAALRMGNLKAKTGAK